MSHFKQIEIEPIDEVFAWEIAELMQGAGKDYSKYFIPFKTDEQTIKKVLAKADDDCYFGVFLNTSLAGFYMLRGFAEGYEIPSYGVWIAPEFSGKGLAKLTLAHAISFCKINDIKKLMLKVHPENITAKNMYLHAGFELSGTDPKIGHEIYYKTL